MKNINEQIEVKPKYDLRGKLKVGDRVRIGRTTTGYIEEGEAVVESITDHSYCLKYDGLTQWLNFDWDTEVYILPEPLKVGDFVRKLAPGGEGVFSNDTFDFGVVIAVNPDRVKVAYQLRESSQYVHGRSQSPEVLTKLKTAGIHFDWVTS